MLLYERGICSLTQGIVETVVPSVVEMLKILLCRMAGRNDKFSTVPSLFSFHSFHY
jgi:hypothetical protein